MALGRGLSLHLSLQCHPPELDLDRWQQLTDQLGKFPIGHAKEISPFFNQRILACPASSPHTTHGGAGMVLLMSKAAQDYS